MTLLLVYAAVAIGFSFVCSILEAVLLSVSDSYVETLRESNTKLADSLTSLRQNIGRSLSAILILNTVAHTAGAAGVGAQAGKVWAENENILGMTAAVLTVAVVVLSEIIPKTIGATYWKSLTGVTVATLKLLIIVLFPAVWLSEMLMKLLGTKEHQAVVSREEITAMARAGERDGVLEESESRILFNLFRFGQTRTKDIMTPRTVVAFLPGDMKVLDAMKDEGLAKFSRLPVFEERRDNVLGYVLKDEVLLRAARDDHHVTVDSLVRPFSIVQETLPVARLFDKMLNEREQIMLVVDEYGGVDGVVTMEDVLETLLGREIVDEADSAVDLRELAKAKWEERSEKIASEAPPGIAPQKD